MADEKGPPKNALYRRVEQLERWKGSATDQEPPVRKRPEVRVKFADGCMFLAACFSGDLDEVRSFLERGADINTANIDGLTALHQACIDQNMTMVEFLVDNKADVDVCDNEGWTPLHATASCGFTEIARYLIECGANVAAVNNDGDLPIDICEDDRVQTLLQEEMDKQGIDAEAARRMEEEMMLADANQWLNNRSVKEKPHAQTGATALHVASAKGYVNVMKVLIQANANLNAQDVDGWTPLHAGAHWGQEEACKLLAESLCDMEIKNSAGQTAFDVADPDVLGILEEEKKRQATLREKADVSDIIQTKAPGKRRSSVTRMSGEKKQNVTKSSEQKAVLSSGDVDVHSCSSSDQESDDSETDKKNAINKKAKMDAQVPDLHVQTTGHSQEPAKEIPRIEEVPENTRVTPSPPTEQEAPKPPTPVDNIPTLVLPADTQSRLNARRALLKTGSSSMLPDTTPESVVSYRGRVLRSLSAPRVPHDLDQTQAKESVPIITDPSEKKEDKADRLSSSYTSSYQPRVYNSSYVPFYRRKLDEEKKEKEREVKPEEPPKSTETITDATEVVKANGPAKAPETAVVDEEKSKETSPRDRLGERATDKTPSRISPSRTSPDVSDKLSDKKEPSPPVRGRVDSTQSEEAELQRKARAKRSRETRRPTQGVTRDDIVKAEEVLRATREKEEKDTQDRVKTTSSVSAITTTTTSTSGDSLRDEPVRRPRTLEERKEEEFRVGSRRSRIPDLSSSMSNIPTKTSEPSTVSQHTPSTRNSLTTTASNSEPSLTTGSSLNRSTSLRRSRITEPDKVEEKKEEKKEENKDQPKVTAATRARRRREKRNLTGIIDPNNPNNENKEDTEEKKEEKKEEEPSKEDRTDFSYRPERGSSRYSRPSSYTDLSKSTSSLDTDYKRMYDDEKQENEKLKKDLAQTKRDLEQAQRELDRALRKRDSDVKQEKRSLERKVSELEEELKKMKEDNDRVKQENQALIRVISRLSR